MCQINSENKSLCLSDFWARLSETTSQVEQKRGKPTFLCFIFEYLCILSRSEVSEVRAVFIY